MTTLDALAHRSASAVETAFAHHPIPPIGGAVVAARLAALRRGMGYALAGVAGVALAIVALIAIVQPVDDAAETPTTTPPPTVVEQTVPTTTPTDSPEIVETAPPGPPVVPIGGGETNNPPAASPAPWLRIVSPESGASVSARAIEVVGRTDPGSKVWAPNGTEIAVGDDGAWSHVAELETGRNRLTYTATNDSDVVASAFVSIVFTPPPTTTTTTTRPKPTTTTTEAPRWEFTAYNTYGSCEFDPPYDIFYGTGKPGTEIQILSEYGNGSTMVGAEGNWEVKVFFPTAPPGVEFSVKVKDFTGAKKTFGFIFTG